MHRLFKIGAPLLALHLASTPLTAAERAADPKPASRHTIEANRAVAARYPLANGQDFDDARRGFVAALPGGLIKNARGETVWDANRFAFIDGDAPDTVNPSLWRQEKLNNIAGLFKVTDGIWQVRGYDLSNMTLIEGRSGWIVIDPLLSAETARATFEFAMQHLGRKPVVAVIYTHSHADHFGGIRGVIDEADVRTGKVAIIAPDGFMDHAVAENVLAGNAMNRRAQYQFGVALDFGPRGAVGAGLGKAISIGTIGLIPPTDIVRQSGEERVVDGVRIVFQMANGSEAPAEFTFYFPDLKALCLSEVVTSNQHNIYTLRGAKMRDALGWSKYINEMMDRFPMAQVAFRSHHWPVWGSNRIRHHLTNQRDAYRFIHDKAVQMANEGATMDEIGDHVDFPSGLADDFTTHGYYGTLSHNLRAVYNFYLGYFDGNPASLHALPPQARAAHYVAAMGGAKAVSARVQEAAAAGDYRWAAELNNHVVFADPQNESARLLQADILEQLGYQAESGVWRNEYLSAARELRHGIKAVAVSTQGPDLVRGMSVDLIFDTIAVRLDHAKLDGMRLGINLELTDRQTTYALELSNGVLNNTRGRVLAAPDATLRLSSAALFKMLLAKVPLAQLIQAGEAQLAGDGKALGAILSNIKNFDPQFAIVTP